MADAPKRDWKKIVEDSNGALMMAPEQFIPMIKEWDESRQELSRLANAAAKHELKTRMLLENGIVEIREYLEKAGIADVYLKDIGFQSNALDEGLCILTINDGK